MLLNIMWGSRVTVSPDSLLDFKEGGKRSTTFIYDVANNGLEVEPGDITHAEMRDDEDYSDYPELHNIAQEYGVESSEFGEFFRSQEELLAGRAGNAELLSELPVDSDGIMPDTPIVSIWNEDIKRNVLIRMMKKLDKNLHEDRHEFLFIPDRKIS